MGSWAIITVLFLCLALTVDCSASDKTVKEASELKHSRITHATAQKTLNELKKHHVSLASQTLQSNGTSAEDDSKDDSDDSDGGMAIAEGDDDRKDEPADDDDSRSGFWKKIIGGNSMVPGDEDKHPSKHVPHLVWLLPVIAFFGVGIAIGAYCLLAT
mmetsp:Transcript_11706/g.24178  ORF Transcript_11706/g.24178 Transcript_11706/m.24178 type:complete len:158 (-) Transcript_11706:49-522(-)